MTDQSIEEARSRWAASLRESTARYRALLLESNAPAGLIEELDFFDRPIDLMVTQPVLSPHTSSAEAPACQELLAALNVLRARYVDRGAAHAAAGLGQETLGSLEVDEVVHHQGLMAEIERLERAMTEAGCRV